MQFVAVTFTFSACSVSYVRKDADPLKGGEKVGILVARMDVTRPGIVSDIPLGDKLNQIVAVKVAENLRNQLEKEGFTPVIVPEDKGADLVAKYRAIPRGLALKISNPEEASLNDLHDLFKENGLDYLLVYEAHASARLTTLQNLAGAATTATISALTGVVEGNGYKPTILTRTGVLTPDGKFDYYNNEQFTHGGDIADYLDRERMAESIVKHWKESRK